MFTDRVVSSALNNKLLNPAIIYGSAFFYNKKKRRKWVYRSFSKNTARRGYKDGSVVKDTGSSSN